MQGIRLAFLLSLSISRFCLIACNGDSCHPQNNKIKWNVSQPICHFVEVSLQAQLAECRAQVEHWQGVATICELSKQEELAELQKQCDQEIQSLQEALRGQCVCL